MRRHPAILLGVIALIVVPFSQRALAQAKQPDVVVFTNGEKLTGELQTADSGGITFKSNMAGVIKVGWGNIAELTSSKKFAVLDSKLKLNRKDAAALVPQGTVALDAKDKALVVTTQSGDKTVPVAEAAHLLDPAAFDKAVNHPPSFFRGYKGSVTGGVTLVRATQNSSTYNAGFNLVRSTPTVDWLPARDRTTLDFNQSYGQVSQPGTATVKTNILHGDGERDEYFSPRLFAFGSFALDHNYSSALQLQQAYGGGIGMTIIKNAKQQLDVKGNVQFEKQTFFTLPPTVGPASPTQNLIGSLFSENYVRHLPKGINFNEFGSVSPAWNVLNDYSAHVNAGLTFPVYKGFGFNVSAIDDYLNNAPSGSKKNSYQYIMGITYAIK
ncbi:Protein of unknown function, DUF481 [Granulicella rosea]|uniref:Salt-induced outer membrane protein YdiY n=1 Tax=Granulicella rosea TaxID=474952 RepID=A0A239KTL6_9BACT|nr:DUF481 domain-containing protein [Granulicella rosea]SNT21696.1 Protein of unknown function, DUF481 [Granulicella rosea]